MKQFSLMKLLRKIHEDENGTVSLETVLIIGAIAMADFDLPVSRWAGRGSRSYFNARAGRHHQRPRRRDAVIGRAPCWPRLLVLAFTFAAAVTDLLWNKIYNWNTYTGMAAALVWQRDGQRLDTAETRPSRLARAVGAIPWYESAIGLLICGGLMLVCLVLFSDIGGGDVKLMAMLGAWLGREKGIEAMLWTFVLAAACIALIGLIWKVGPLATAGRVGRLFASRLRLYWIAAAHRGRAAVAETADFHRPQCAGGGGDRGV